jgi:hypothetical protein
MRWLKSGKVLIYGLLLSLGMAPNVLASAFVLGAHYKLGDEDPGATAGQVGNNPTRDSFGQMLDLSRLGSPKYSPDVPLQGPAGDKLSMAFANVGLGGPAFPAVYTRTESLPTVEQGFTLETWVKTGPTNLDGPQTVRTSLLAYNGDPATNGFGFFLNDENYVARIGGFERVLGPATIGEWHHLAYVQSLGTSSYYFDGKLVEETTSDPLPLAPSGGFWLGGFGDPLNDGQYLFNGWIDEVRFQSFNPIAAGAFDPTSFLISPVPEPATLCLVAVAASLGAACCIKHRRGVAIARQAAGKFRNEGR